jgi:hypothetical protein
MKIKNRFFELELEIATTRSGDILTSVTHLKLNLSV